MKDKVRTALRWTVAIAALAFVIWVVPFRDRCTADGCEPGLITTVRQARAEMLLLALALYIASTGVWSERWKRLLELADVSLPSRKVWRLTLEAQAGGVLLPGGVGGDALRVAYVRERSPGANLGTVIASIFMDRIIGLSTLAFVAFFAAIFTGGAGVFGWALAAIPVGALATVSALRFVGPRVSKHVQHPLLRRVLDPILAYATHPRGPSVLGRAVLLSLVTSALQLIVVRLFLLAMHAQPTSEPGVYVGTTLGMMVAALPATPGALGTADAAYVLFLGRAGIAAPAAAAACMLYRCYWYISAVIGALLAVGARRSGT